MMYGFERYLLLAFFFSTTSWMGATSSSPPFCTFVMHEDFTSCANRTRELEAYARSKLNRIYNTTEYQHTPTPPECATKTPCRRLFHLGRLRRQSFGSKTRVEISDALQRCCGNCTQYYIHSIYEPLPRANLSFLRELDIIYPVPSRSALINELHGFYFIPVFDIPNAFFITKQPTSKAKTEKIISDCIGMWRLLVICLLMAFIAGSIAWVLETWQNEEEFPRSFYVGLMDGFWWSFVSMTTVGYGDKVPRSFITRLFSVVWILVGITITSLYIAQLSNSIKLDRLDSEALDLKGKRIGALKEALHDSVMIAQHGGIADTTEYNNTVFGIMEMIARVEKEEISGFVLTKPIYYFFARMIEENEKYKQFKPRVDAASLYTREITFPRDSFVSGMLVKRKDDFDYFHRYFASNWLQIQGCYLSSINMKNTKFVPDAGSYLDGLFDPFLAGTLVIIGVVILFGLLFELRTRYKAKKVVHKLSLTTKEAVPEAHAQVEVNKTAAWGSVVITDVKDQG